MDVLDDLQLIAVVQQRVASWLADPGQVVEVTHAELEALASAIKPDNSLTPDKSADSV